VAGLQIINLISEPLFGLSYFSGTFVTFLVSIKRINEFLLSEEKDERMVKC